MFSPVEYRVLARKYRPTTFSTLIGQEIVADILRGGFLTNRLGHSFLLTGIRGVGKTTIARLLARCFNCTTLEEQRQNKALSSHSVGSCAFDPCGQCSGCKSFENDAHLNTIEIDAASHTGVEDIRGIIESSHYQALSGRYKIFIIDEVHMLSKSAFNALLKTLEEPPSYTKFILATTEIRRVPATIVSRCLCFELRPVPPSILVPYLEKVCQKEHVTYETKALQLIAMAGEGSVRDALSLLDQGIVLSSQEDGSYHLTTHIAEEMLGCGNKPLVASAFLSVLQGNPQQTIQQVRSLEKKGTHPSFILERWLQLTHGLTLKRTCPHTPFDVSSSEEEEILQKAPSFSLEALGRLWQLLLHGEAELKEASLTQQCFEMLCLRLIYAQSLPDPRSLLKAVPPLDVSNGSPQQPFSQEDLYQKNAPPKGSPEGPPGGSPGRRLQGSPEGSSQGGSKALSSPNPPLRRKKAKR